MHILTPPNQVVHVTGLVIWMLIESIYALLLSGDATPLVPDCFYTKARTSGLSL